jgi:adenosylcobyric acid synthase
MTLAPVLMVQGTASSAGKSTLVAGLCRLFARRGVRVAPFKAQNMSNNAAVTADGGEIGRAQYAQARAACVEPSVDMNPILLKPQAGASQVVIRGRAVGVQTAAEYFSRKRTAYWPIVAEALDRLRSTYDLVIAEGAGSPAEINLRDRDLVNMRVALHAAPDADVLLVSDIDRGGAFAALLGTWQWLSEDERQLVRGFVLNKFRGDASLLEPAPTLLGQRTGVPVLGVVPYLDDLGLAEEDAASLSERRRDDAEIEIAVVRVPHLSNFDEFGPLAAEPNVWLRYVQTASALRAPDLVILPGSKATLPDVAWLHDRELARRIQWLARHGTPVLGICGGFQMLGQHVADPSRYESDLESVDGLALLPIRTELLGDKTLRQVAGFGHSEINGFWSCLSGQPVGGYEIHVGVTPLRGQAPLLDLESHVDGLVVGDVAGTYVHGVLEGTQPRRALLAALANARGFDAHNGNTEREDQYDRLADVLEASLDLRALPSLAKLQAQQRH